MKKVVTCERIYRETKEALAAGTRTEATLSENEKTIFKANGFEIIYSHFYNYKKKEEGSEDLALLLEKDNYLIELLLSEKNKFNKTHKIYDYEKKMVHQHMIYTIVDKKNDNSFGGIKSFDNTTKITFILDLINSTIKKYENRKNGEFCKCVIS